MAYATSNPPFLVSQGLGGKGRQWRYESADAGSAVDLDGYISNGKALGMQVNDLVQVVDTDTGATTSHVVVAVNANGSVDLADGTAIGSATDTD